ncbi:MAG: HEAT repeat domain-containing protein [Phycisphaerae bacterium]
MPRATLSKAAAAIAVLLIFASTGPAQQAGSPDGESPEQLWEDFIHYIKIARPELARSYGQALLDSDADAKTIYEFSQTTPDARATLTRGERLEGLGETIDEIRERIERGYREKRSDPREIAWAIELLAGTLRGYELGAERLRNSGQFALPQLLNKLRDDQAPQMLKERIITILPSIGREAVRGLSAALQSDEPLIVEIMAGALGEIGYAHAAPRLREALEREDLPERTRKIVRSALVTCAGESAPQKSVAEMFYRTAENYYYKAESLRADERYGEANLWYWSDDVGLAFRPAPLEIFYDAYTMRFCRLALAHDSGFSPAVGLWLAANLRKEANLPEGAEDPVRREDQPSVDYYALASGAGYLQGVLARGLRDRDTAVATGAITALAETAGAESLVQPVEGGAQPLVEAMSYPDRRVRFLAAVSLAEALPRKEFTGHGMVLWTLNEALRQTGQQRAMLVVADEQMRNRLKSVLRDQDFDVLDSADVAEAMSSARASAGVDVVVLGGRPDPVEVVGSLRREAVFLALPVIVARQTARVEDVAEEDGRVVVIPDTADEATISEAIDEAMRLANGRSIDAEEAEQWALRAARALERLGMTSNVIFDVTRSREALGEAINAGSDAVKVACAAALAAMDDSSAQRMVAELALNADESETVRISAFEELSASLRRFGNCLRGEQSDAVVRVVGDGDSFELRTAAAEALGAMDLPSEDITDLILDTGSAAGG